MQVYHTNQKHFQVLKIMKDTPKNIAINVIKIIITDFCKYIGEIVLIKLKSSNVANKSLK